MSDDLPLPETPRTTTISPGLTTSETSDRATTRPPAVWYVSFRSLPATPLGEGGGVVVPIGIGIRGIDMTETLHAM